jgi:hypothetical protein
MSENELNLSGGETGCDHTVVRDAQILDIEGIEIMRHFWVESSGKRCERCCERVVIMSSPHEGNLLNNCLVKAVERQIQGETHRLRSCRMIESFAIAEPPKLHAMSTNVGREPVRNSKSL